jgi:hypothetical protein
LTEENAMPSTRPTRTHVTLALLALSASTLLVQARLAAQDESPSIAGPDVTVIYLGSTSNWGSSGGVRAYSVGTTSCNVGATPVAWCDSASCVDGTLQRNDHPVIAQNIYRLTTDRFEQIGMSWLKHGWLSTNTPDGACGSCVTPPGDGDQLGVGCTDTYGSGLNGGQGNPGTCDSGSCRLGQRSAVNATTGDFPMPYANIAHPSAIDQRIQVQETDLDPVTNPGALYFVEGQYIAGDDGAANNAFNNASYRAVTIGSAPNYNLSLTGPTIREKTALQAWVTADPAVEFLALDIPGSSPTERFEIARKITGPVGGVWHFEYAIRNLNSDRSAQALTIDFPDGTAITNVGFKDIDHHSGEVYSNADWTSTVDGPSSVVAWSTTPYGTDPNANALRFATLFNFRFDADSDAPNLHSLALFKPGAPESVTFWAGSLIFADDFESSDSSAWSATFP